MVDRSIPQFDRDAGSRSLYEYICLFVSLGFRVFFLPDDQVQRQPYADALAVLGVEVLRGKGIRCGGWKRWFRRNSDAIDFAMLCRPNVAPRYIDYIRRWSGVRIFYMGVDLRYLRDERRGRVEGDDYYRRESAHWKPIELGLCERADVAYFFSSEEVREVARNAPTAVAKAIPLFFGDDGIEDDGLSFDQRTNLLFVGNFAHAPNAEALQWFANEVLPKVRGALPALRVVAVGANCPAHLKKSLEDRVFFVGSVPSDELRALYRSCKLAIAPLRYGAGIKGKVVEAIQLGVPIVTTSIGGEGLPDVEAVLPIADSAEEFARRVVEIAGNEACWTGVRADLRRYAVVHFSRENALRIMGVDLGLSNRKPGGQV